MTLVANQSCNNRPCVIIHKGDGARFVTFTQNVAPPLANGGRAFFSPGGQHGLVDEAVEAIGAAWGLGELGFVHCTHSCVWDLH